MKTEEGKIWGVGGDGEGWGGSTANSVIRPCYPGDRGITVLSAPGFEDNTG